MKNNFIKFIEYDSRRGSFYFGLFLALFGTLLLLSNLGIIPSGFWNIFWPMLLIALGLYLLSKRLNIKKSNTVKIKRKD